MRMYLLMGILTLGCLTERVARALTFSDLPASTTWVLTADMRAANESSLVKLIAERIGEETRKQAERKLAAIEALFGVDLVKQIDYLAIAGDGDAKESGVVYIKAAFDEPRLATIVAGMAGYQALEHAGLKIHGWKEKSDGKSKYICFARPGLALFSERLSLVKRAVAVLAGEAVALDSHSSFAPAFQRSSESIISLYASGVAGIVGNNPQAAMFKQTDGLTLRVGTPDDESLCARLTLTAQSEDKAQQVHQALLGLQALALLRAADAPESATLAEQLRMEREGNDLGVRLALPKTLILEMLRSYQQREHSASQVQ